MTFFFRLHPAVYWAAGLAIAALGAFVYFDILEENAANAIALGLEPPQAVVLQEFDPAEHANAAKEVVLIAELEPGARFSLTKERSGVVTDRNWTAPLRDAVKEGSGGSPDANIRAAIYESDGDVPEDRLQAWVIGNGPNGPLLRLHGVLTRPSSSQREQIAIAFAERGLTLAEDAIFIDPFLKPREIELAQKDPTGASVFIAGAGGLVFLYGFLRSWLRRRSRADA